MEHGRIHKLENMGRHRNRRSKRSSEDYYPFQMMKLAFQFYGASPLYPPAGLNHITDVSSSANHQWNFSFALLLFKWNKKLQIYVLISKTSSQSEIQSEQKEWGDYSSHFRQKSTTCADRLWKMHRMQKTKKTRMASQNVRRNQDKQKWEKIDARVFLK